MNRILFIAEGKSFLVTSFREQLEKIGYQAAVMRANMDMINAFKEPVGGVLIFVDEKVLEQAAALVFLKDWSIEKGVPIFTLGIQTDVEDLKSVIPANLIHLEFIRPIRVLIKEIVRQIDYFIKNNLVRKKVLIVGGNGRALKNRLKFKYNVILAKSCGAAIKNLALNRPDLVLIDYEMNSTDGKQVYDTIQTESEFSDIPVIFLKFKDEKDIEEAIDDFFGKLKAGT